VVLTPDAYPPIHGCVTVQVERSRADVPSFDQLVEQVRQLSDALMLAGLVRVCGVGVPPRWHALIREHTDPRVALVLLPGGARDLRTAVNDCSNGDVVWSWEQPSGAAIEAYSNGARVWCWARPSGPSDLSTALRALCLALQGSQQ